MNQSAIRRSTGSTQVMSPLSDPGLSPLGSFFFLFLSRFSPFLSDGDRNWAEFLCNVSSLHEGTGSVFTNKFSALRTMVYVHE